jgi:hypothetical protein
MLFVVGVDAVSPVGAEGPFDPPGICVTTAVASDVAVVDPLRVAAKTLKRRVEPRSSDVRV